MIKSTVSLEARAGHFVPNVAVIFICHNRNIQYARGIFH